VLGDGGKATLLGVIPVPHDSPAGIVAVRATVPANPFRLVTVIVEEAVAGFTTEEEDAAMPKSAGAVLKVKTAVAV